MLKSYFGGHRKELSDVENVANFNPTSFITSNYVIYKPYTLSENANWIAYRQGTTQLSRMLYDRSTDVRSSFTHFCDYLEKIANRQAQTERAFLEMQLGRIQTALKQNEDVFGLDRQEAIILAKILQKVLGSKDPNYSEAFTAFFNHKQTYSEMKREVTQTKNEVVGRMTSLYEQRFSTWMSKKITELSEEMLKQPGEVFDDLIQQYFVEMAGLDNSSPEKFMEELNRTLLSDSYESLRRSISNKLSQYGFPPLDANYTPPPPKKKLSSDKIFKTKTGRKRTSVPTMVKTLLGEVGNGLGEELRDIGAGKRTGATGLNTARIRERIKSKAGKDMTVQGTTDNILIYSTNTISFDISKALESLTKQFNNDAEALEALIQRIERENYDEEFFTVHISDKEYVSRHPLQVMGDRSFLNASRRLEKMYTNTGIDSNYFNKLLFLLVNTTEGAIAENMVDRVALNIASVFALWTWQDFTNLMGEEGILKEVNKSNNNRVHLFNQGGAYFSASQLIRTVLEQLRTNVKLSEASSFVQVNISPAPLYPTKSEYNNWLNASRDKYNDPNTTDEEWQQLLEKRWNTVRNEVLKNGHLSIHFDQDLLNKLLNNLQIIVSESP